MPAYNAVTNTATGGLLRYGACDFLNDGQFKGATETYTTNVGKRLNTVPKKYHKISLGIFAEMTQPEKDAVDAAEVSLTVIDGLISGLKLEFNSVSLVRITSGFCRDSSNKFNMVLLADTDIDFSVTGSAGGLQVAEAVSTFYDCFVIGDSTQANPVNTWAVPQSTAISLPSGYNRSRYVGSVRNNSSGNIINFICSGLGRQRKYQYRGASSELEVYNSGGTANVFTSLNLSSLVPIGTEFIDLGINLDMDADDDKIFLQSGINPQTTANALIKFGAGLQTVDFQFFDTQVWGMAINPVIPSLEWGTSQASQDVILTIIGYNLNL